jgi:hypothetical protein
LVSALATLTLAFGLSASDGSDGGPSLSAPVPAGDSVRPVLGRERFPWYDARAGRVKPLLPWPDLHFQWLNNLGDWISHRAQAIARWFRWLNRWRVPAIGTGMGDLVAIGLVLLVLTLVLVLLLELLRRYRPALGDDAAARAAAARAGSTTRIEGLPAGAGFDAADPWSEARRLRGLGDYAGAVVYLFAHQLLALHRRKRLRLVPGRTGRQLVGSVADRDLRLCVEPTLRLFELVYYGHRSPSAEAFEAVWRRAEEFEQRMALEALS